MRMFYSLTLAILASFILSTFAHAKVYGEKICSEPEFTCYTVKKGDSWTSLFPDETERDMVKRINRMNTNIWRGLVIAIPVNMNTTIMDYAPFPLQGEVTGNPYIIVSKSKLAFGAYDESGNLAHWGPVSTGKGYCRDVRRNCGTPSGTYAIYKKGGAGCRSSKFPIGRGGAPMPYCMFFHGGFAMHGAPEVPVTMRATAVCACIKKMRAGSAQNSPMV